MEEWRKHPVYSNYEGSNLGRIRNTDYHRSGKTRVLKQVNVGIGYLGIGIHKNGTTKQYLSHRFIYECWYDIIPEGMTIDHINTVRTDNRIENLCCCSTRDNMNNPLTKKHIRENKTKSPVIQFNKTGEEIKRYNSVLEASRELNITYTCITNNLKGRSNTAGGYIWKYAS